MPQLDMYNVTELDKELFLQGKLKFLNAQLLSDIVATAKTL